MNTNPNPTPKANTDVLIGRNVHQLMWSRRETQTTVAAALGIGQSALSLKLRGDRPWNSEEIDFMARRYGITHGELFSQELPHLDSNQEPTGSPLGLIIHADFAKKTLRTHTNMQASTMPTEGEIA